MRIVVLLTVVLGFMGSFCFAQKNSKVLNSVLWKVQSPNSEKVSYILGSTHLFGRDWVDSWKLLDSLVAVQENFICENTLALGDINRDSASDEFYPKSLKARKLFGDNFNNVNDYFLKINGIGIEKGIDESKSPEGSLFLLLYYLLNEIATKYNLKISDDFVAMDDVLLFKANSREKKCIGLDNLIEIKEVLSSQSIQDTLVSSIVELVKGQQLKFPAEKSEHFNEFVNGMVNYNKGKYLYDFSYGQSSNIDAALKVVSRNNFWMKKIPQLVTSHNSFIVVGIAHLDGKEGIINLLRKQKFKIYPVELN